MFPVQLKSGVRFELFDEVFIILKRLPDLKIEAEEDKFKGIKIFTFVELVKHLGTGNLKFECIGKNLESNLTPSLSTSFFIEDLKDSKHKERAVFRYEVIAPILKTPVNQRNNAIISRVQEINSWSDNSKKATQHLNGCSYYQTVSHTSVYRWLKDFIESNGDIRSLFPSYHTSGGKDKPRIEPQILEFMKEAIDESYNKKQRITIRELWFCIITKISDLINSLQESYNFLHIHR